MNNEPQKTLLRDLTTGSVPKQLLLFAAPLFLSNLLQIVYNMADMLIVGRYAGSVGLSAVSVGGDVQNFLTFVAMGFSNAGQVIISQLVGADQRHRIGSFVGTMFTFLFLCTVVFSSLCLCLRTSILNWMNTPPESWDATLAYATTCAAGLVFIYGYNTISAVLRGIGDSKHPLIFISIAALLNVVLDLVFVAGLHLNAFGAALATVISQGISFIIAVIFWFRNRTLFGFELHLRDFRPDRAMLGKLLGLGIPMAIKSAAVQFSKLFVNSWINSYGVTVSAVSGIANKFSSISNLFSNSMNTAGSSMIGQNIGAQKYRRVPRIIGVCLAICSGISTLLVFAIVTFPKPIFGLFTSDPDALRVAMDYIPAAVLVFIGSALRSPANALINGSGNYKINFAVAMLDGVIMRIGLALLLGLGLHMGYLGFWLGDALAGFTPFFIGIVFYLSGRWKTQKYAL